MIPRRQPRVPSMGFDSRQYSDARSNFRSASVASPVASLTISSSWSGRNSCKGGSSSRTVTGSPSMASRMPSKSISCCARSSSSDDASSASLSARIMRCTIGSRSEHVLGTAEADALRAELPCLSRVLGKVGIRPYLQPAQLVGPTEDDAEVARRLGRHYRDLADDDLAGRARDGDHVALAHRRAVDREPSRAEVDLHCFRTADRGLAHAACDDGCVRDQPTARREDALGRDHAVQVVGRRLGPHEDDALPRFPPGLGFVGGEVHLADRRAGRRVQALGEHRVGRLRVELGVQQLIELSPSCSISTAIRSAAAAVRLPTRVWSMNRRPCSIVNSMSHMSR